MTVKNAMSFARHKVVSREKRRWRRAYYYLLSSGQKQSDGVMWRVKADDLYCCGIEK